MRLPEMSQPPRREPAASPPSRRSVLALLASTAMLAPPALAQNPTTPSGRNAADGQPPGTPRPGTFSYAEVVNQARILAERPFDDAQPDIPDALRALTYDSYREIRFRRDKALWQNDGTDFRLQLFHLGFLHDRPVQIHVVSNGNAIPIPYNMALFEFGKAPVPQKLPVSLGFAGFSVTTTLNSLKLQDEVISFLGASYFRFLGRGHRYGLSARALALDVGGEADEEFPFFRSLWLERPKPESVDLVVYGLVDSPSVSGAFRFVVTPGPQTRIAVTATIIPRKPIQRIGIAPLTSMFLAGEGDREQRTDFRPEIHDSDGLMLHTGVGEWIWRPIRNPKALIISSFHDRNPRGFGLIQRDREFGHYQDLEAHYHARPGYWIEPVGEWGEGRVDLIEIPTQGEEFDNIVCCWTPKTPLEPGRQTELSYRMTSVSTTETLHGMGQVQSSFAADDAVDTAAGLVRKRFIVDFNAGDLEFYLSDPKRVSAVATVSVGSVTNTILDPNYAAKGFRAIVDVALRPGESTDLRLFLRTPLRSLTETWTTSWSAPGSAPPPAASGG
ncbi:glucan biosynthesis protein [Bosea rubneri]|uniref:Glucan biosynthesis protein n=1 Tax=Bosea rubneri TaxID=3075434 RepID=A0ABU3S6U3_9HYPH|nr:glucan biosynthesis protein [Bosea sp. ZW T0_25]MDU0340092.1 glucan biosynthesis protein [Bosea sp. ZW T0_25]